MADTVIYTDKGESMTSYPTLRTLRDDLADAVLRHPHDAKLQQIRDQIATLTEQARRLERPVLVFDMSNTQASHAIEVGRFGAERQVPDPYIAGLWAAWRILAFRQGANGMAPADLLEDPGSDPAEALRKQLRRAAEWVEVTAGCPELALAILQIRTTGGVITIRGELPEIHLML